MLACLKLIRKLKKNVFKSCIQFQRLFILAQLLSDKPQLRSITENQLVGRKSTVGGKASEPVEAEDSDDEEENFKDADKAEEDVKAPKGK